MASYQVVSIIKTNPQNSTEFITHIGYYESKKKPLVIITTEEAIRRIENNRYEFYVKALFDTPYVEIVRQHGRNSYLRTTPDPFKMDNLLRLTNTNYFLKHDNTLKY